MRGSIPPLPVIRLHGTLINHRDTFVLQWTESRAQFPADSEGDGCKWVWPISCIGKINYHVITALRIHLQRKTKFTFTQSHNINHTKSVNTFLSSLMASTSVLQISCRFVLCFISLRLVQWIFQQFCILNCLPMHLRGVALS